MNIRKYVVFLVQFTGFFFVKLVVWTFCSQYYHGVGSLKKRPHLLVANHKHAIDPFILSASLPGANVLKIIPITFMTANFFYNSPLKPFLWIYGCFPARNKSGKEKLYGVEGANSLIKNGFSLQIFPEGTRIRHNGRHPAYPGVIAIHQANPDVPVILCHIEHNKGLKALLQRRWFVISFALEENARYTDADALMDRVYSLSTTEDSQVIDLQKS